MPKRDWHTPASFVIFGLLLAATLAWIAWDYSALLSEQRVRQEEYAQRNAQETTSRIERECTVTEFVALRNCIEQQINADADEQRSQQDLIAQETMARFTAVMGYAALMGLVVGGVSIWLIWRTLRETQRMADDTREIGVAQTRPWLSIDLEVASDLVITEGNGRITIDATIKNYGATPAVGVWLDVEAITGYLKRSDALDELRSKSPKAPQKRSSLGYRIFPTQDISIGTSIPVEIPLEDIEKGIMSVAIIGFVQYMTPGTTVYNSTDVCMDLIDVKSGMGIGMSPKDGIIPAQNLRLQHRFGQGAVK